MIFLIAALEKIDFTFFLVSLKLIKTKYKNVSEMVPSRKSNIYHQPLHASVNKPVEKPAMNDKIIIFSVLLLSIVNTKSHVISNGKKTTHTSLSGCKVLKKKPPLPAITVLAKNPPTLPAIFLAKKKTINTHIAEKNT